MGKVNCRSIQCQSQINSYLHVRQYKNTFELFQLFTKKYFILTTRPTAKDDIKGYDVWVLNTTEVEIDVLTGEYKVAY